MTEREKLEQGLWYDANYDSELLLERAKADAMIFEFNNTHPQKTEEKDKIIKQLLPNMEDKVAISSPFYTDYGYNCFIASDTFINRHAYLMDGAKITIGSHCFIGPNCGMYTANHPLLSEQRNLGYEMAQPITIGDNVWIGANVTILAGVTIGHNTVIGANSVVTKDIGDNVVAVGNPCIAIRKITENDRIELMNELD